MSFISHAHSDHRPSSVNGKVIASRETAFLSGIKETHNRSEETEVNGLKLKILHSGHMFGAGQLFIENDFKLVYTGDLNLEGGATAKKAEIEKCDVLIIETTYGSPYYKFPERDEVVRGIKDWIKDCFSKGVKPCLLAYSMGKAQELTKYLSGEFCVEVAPSIYKNNKKYEELGADLGKYCLLGDSNGDRVLIVPPGPKKPSKGCCTAVATGWALHRGANQLYSVDEAFPLSDHSDFSGLLEYTERADPQVVYTTHGFAEEFSEELRMRGFYSEPLRKIESVKGQAILQDF